MNLYISSPYLPSFNKNKNSWSCLLVFLLVFASCKDRDKKSDRSDTYTDSIPAIKQASFSDPYFYKTLEGTIAGKPVVMHFLKYKNQVDANYYYVNEGQTIFLVRDWERGGTDSIYLLENTDNGSGKSPEISLAITSSGLAGIWKNPDNKESYPITLQESAANPSLRFSVLGYADSAACLKFKTDTPTLKSSVVLVMAGEDNDEAEWLNKRIKNILDNGNSRYASLSLPQVVQSMVKDAVAGYAADVDSSLVGVNIDSDSPHFFLSREYSTVGNIIYNDNGYVVLSIFNYAYTGGAHGNYGTSMHCFDVAAKKRMTLQDMVHIDSVALQGLLEKNYRKRYRLPASEPLEKRLFVKNLAANNNFYFSPMGLGFIYAPYEIASYADGEINVWIPFAELKPYLNPEFAKRMNL